MITLPEFHAALEACKMADKAILNVCESTDWGFTRKDDRSPLTKADKDSHEVIMQYLKSTGLPVLSEEGKSIDYNERKDWNKFWLVDPLDGTKEFLKRNGEFTVNIALIENNKPVWGIVSAPVLDKTYFIDEGGKVGMRKGDKTIMLSAKGRHFDANKSGNRVVASRSHMDEKTKAFVESLDEPVIVSMGSSLKFMMLAEGMADVYPRFAPTSEWDTAASHAILNALGYRIFQEDSKAELMYNKENILNPGFIAYASAAAVN